MSEKQFLDLYRCTAENISPQTFYASLMELYISTRDFWYDKGWNRMYKEAEQIILNRK